LWFWGALASLVAMESLANRQARHDEPWCSGSEISSFTLWRLGQIKHREITR
jgi:hypothetical protein